VLTGIDENDWPKIRQIVIEVHDLGGRLNEITSLLDQHGFNVKIEQDAMYEGSVLYNLFATKQPAVFVSSHSLKSHSLQQIQRRAKKRADAIREQRTSRRKSL
jgi:hypothetical protein